MMTMRRLWYDDDNVDEHADDNNDDNDTKDNKNARGDWKQQ